MVWTNGDWQTTGTGTWPSGSLQTTVSTGTLRGFLYAVPMFLNNVDRDRYHLARARNAPETPARAPRAALWRPRPARVRRAMRSRGSTGWIRRGHRRPLRLTRRERP